MRRLEPLVSIDFPDALGARLVLYLDVETTGLDPNVDEIIKLAVAPLRYAMAGDIAVVGEP